MNAMATKLVLFWCFVSVFSAASPTASQEKLPAQHPAQVILPHALAEYFIGNWVGKGKFANGKEIASDVSIQPDLEGQCLVVRQKERSPNNFQFIGLWTMDSANQTIVMLLASNHESGGRLFRSQGWPGARIVFQSTAELRANWAIERITFERKSNDSFDATYEYSQDNGKTWRLGDEQTFTRKPSSD
jgi:hypothetical protein